MNELTRRFLIDYDQNVKKPTDIFESYYGHTMSEGEGYCIPFGDGPKPIYDKQVSKTAIMNLLGGGNSHQQKNSGLPRCFFVSVPMVYIFMKTMNRTQSM